MTDTRFTLEIITREYTDAFGDERWESRPVRRNGQTAVYTGEQTALDAAQRVHERTGRPVIVVDEYRDIVANVG